MPELRENYEAQCAHSFGGTTLPCCHKYIVPLNEEVAFENLLIDRSP